MRMEEIKKGLVLLVLFPLFFSGCKPSEIPLFDSKSMLYIQQDDFVDGESLDLANLQRSFALYPGEEYIEVSFKVNLIGAVTDYDRPFEVVQNEKKVDTLKVTAADGSVKKYRLYPAEESEFEILTPVLKANEITSDLVVRLRKSARMETDTVRLAFHLVPNEHFDTGYENRLSARVDYGNYPLKPSWWTLYIETSYLGAYSAAKFEAFYNFCKESGISVDIVAEKEASELRELSLQFKRYIQEHGLKESDGSPMELPII